MTLLGRRGSLPFPLSGLAAVLHFLVGRRMKALGRVVTVLQIAQMGVGCVTVALHFYLLRFSSNAATTRRDARHFSYAIDNTRSECDGSLENLYLAGCMYLSYLLLFVQFYARKYRRSGRPSRGCKPVSCPSQKAKTK